MRIFSAAVLIMSIVLLVMTCLVCASEITTVAVLPFVNISKNPQIDWIGAGFAETIATKLCKVSGIQYVERAQLSQAMKELKLHNSGLVDSTTARKLGKLAGAECVVIGSYQKSGDKLKVDARVVEVETSRATKSAEVVGKIDDVFDMQADLVGQLIESIGNSATAAETKAIEEAPAKSNKAYQWFAKGLDFQNKGKPALAIPAYNEAIKLDPAYTDAYINRGNSYRDTGDNDKAILDYNKAIKLQPDYALSYNNRGYAYDCKHETDKAIADYNKAIELDPNLPYTYNNRGIVYSIQGEYDKSIADYNKAIELSPDYVEAYYNRGIAYAGKGDHDSAIADYGKTIELKPDYVDAYYNRGVSYTAKNDNENAIKDYTKAIELKPDNANAYNNRGGAYFAVNETGKAMADYNKTIELNPKDAYPYYGRAQVYAARGDKELAIADYKQFIKLASRNDTEWIDMAKSKIRELESN